MVGYSKMGVEHWGRVSAWDKRKFSIPLSGKVAENDGDLSQTIWKNRGVLFIPMPRVNYQKHIEQCFFLPVGKPGDTKLDV